MTKKKWLHEFGVKYYKNYPEGFVVDDKMSHTAIHNWLRAVLETYEVEKQEYGDQRAKEAAEKERNNVIEKIEAAKSQIQEATGSFKYDFAFEMIEDIIRNK